MGNALSDYRRRAPQPQPKPENTLQQMLAVIAQQRGAQGGPTRHIVADYRNRPDLRQSTNVEDRTKPMSETDRRSAVVASALDQMLMGYGDNLLAGAMAVLPGGSGDVGTEFGRIKELETQFKNQHPGQNAVMRGAAEIGSPGGILKNWKTMRRIVNQPRSPLELLGDIFYAQYAGNNLVRDWIPEATQAKAVNPQSPFPNARGVPADLTAVAPPLPHTRFDKAISEGTKKLMPPEGRFVRGGRRVF